MYMTILYNYMMKTKKKMKVLSVRIPQIFFDALQTEADEKFTTITEVVKALLRQHIQEQNEEQT